MNIEEMRKEIKPYEKEKPYVFISYSKKDAEFVYPVILQLQKRGVNLWIDKNLEGTGGQSWQANAFDVISEYECKKILFFMSRNSFLSMPCCAELLYTLTDDISLVHKDGVPVVPISVEKEINLGQIIKLCEVQNDYNSKIDETAYKNIIQNSLTVELKNLMSKMGSQGKIPKSTIINKVKEYVFNNDSEITVVNTDIDAILTNIPDECKNQNSIKSEINNSNDLSGMNQEKIDARENKVIKEVKNDDKKGVEKNNIGISKSDIKKATEESIKELILEGKDIYEIDQNGEPHFYTKRMDEYLSNANKSKSAWGDEILYRYEIKTDKLDSNKLGVRFTPNKIGATAEVNKKMFNMHKTRTAQKEGGNYNIKEDFTWGRVISKYEEISEKVSYDELKQIIKKWILYLLDMEQQIFDEMLGNVVVEIREEVLTGEEAIRAKYWEKLNEVLSTRSDCKLQVKYIRNHNYCAVKGNLFRGIEVQAGLTKKRIHAYLWINKDNNKPLNQKIFDVLVTQKECVEAELSKYKNVVCVWERDKGSDNVSCGVEINMENVDFTNESDWSTQHEFLADAMILLDNKLVRPNEEKLKNIYEGEK